MSNVTLGVIPARLDSTRLSQKILRPICGQPMIKYVWEVASKAKSLDRVVIACDNIKVKKVVEEFGAEAVLTDISHNSGTSRITEVLSEYTDTNYIVNIQADEPLLPVEYIERLVESIKRYSTDFHIVTLAVLLEDEEQVNNDNVVKVVFNKENKALYFSRAVIPYRKKILFSQAVYYKHIGVYAYTRQFLENYASLQESKLENCEDLEQLRFLYAGYDIRIEVVGVDTIGVDVEADITRVEEILDARG